MLGGRVEVVDERVVAGRVEVLVPLEGDDALDDEREHRQQRGDDRDGVDHDPGHDVAPLGLPALQLDRRADPGGSASRLRSGVASTSPPSAATARRMAMVAASSSGSRNTATAAPWARLPPSMPLA